VSEERSRRLVAMETRKMEETYEEVRRLSSRSAVVVFGISDCCMCHVAKQLLIGLGVAPTFIDLDRDASGIDIQAVLLRLFGCSTRRHVQPLPAVFIGGKFLGGIESLMACHINGSLVPLLKDAGALWL
ncbi:hypothetical protein Ancab_019048, partial [Ancistrocladus abbreviatus]